MVADVSEQGNQRDEDVKAALDKTVETFGRLDFAFNNASVEQAIASAAELKEEEWDHIVDIASAAGTSCFVGASGARGNLRPKLP